MMTSPGPLVQQRPSTTIEGRLYGVERANGSYK